MPLINPYQLYLEFRNPQQEVLQVQAIDQFSRCLDDLNFSALGQGKIDCRLIDLETALSVQWLEAGPYIRSFTLSFTRPDLSYGKSYSAGVFKSLIREHVEAISRRVHLKPGDKILIRMLAKIKSDLRASRKLAVRLRPQPFPVIQKNFDSFSPPIAPSIPAEASAMTVCIQRGLLAKMVEHTFADVSKEQAGILLGTLNQDPATGRLFLLCSDLLPIAANQQENSSDPVNTMISFKFNPSIFVYLRQEMEKRRRNEILVGWYHSHAAKLPFAGRPVARSTGIGLTTRE